MFTKKSSTTHQKKKIRKQIGQCLRNRARKRFKRIFSREN